ncbi:MAG: GtrA family protein [Candidatus Paceibacterota bacterium]|jgi:putative flippase GtrA
MLSRIDRKGVRRFVRYSGVGVGTFLLDLALLFILTDFLQMQYVVATGLAFALAVSLNYVISRATVFRGTLRSHRRGYVNFILFALVGMGASMAGMHVLVSVFALYYIYARIAVAGFVGVWNYLMNLYVNFAVVGKHE